MDVILEALDMKTGYTAAGGGSWIPCRGDELESVSPIDGRVIGRVRKATRKEYEQVVDQAATAFHHWRMVPAPVRGDIVRQIGDAMRRRKSELGALVSLENGKILAEGEGEVQEMIDMADFAVGQSRMLYGLSMHSERPGHRMYEQWHPLGPVGVITAFNFPVAVWSWNAMIGLICGDTLIWKPSSKTFLTALALLKIAWQIFRDNDLPEGILSVVIGDREDVGGALIDDSRIPLISATGSTAMGQHVGKRVAARLGRSILELGGNNAVIVTPKADLDLAVRAILFGAVGTAGQRCTSTRRVIAHRDVFDRLAQALIQAYRQVPIGDPLVDGTLMGPLIDRQAVDTMQLAIQQITSEGGTILWGGRVLAGGLYDTGTYVSPCIADVRPDMPIVARETFAPILYLMRYDTIAAAIDINNQVPQGLTSAIFTTDLREAEQFLSHAGSDHGIANVNLGTSGAEIGGAFGGEKETGGGREAGSDVWKTYMRRQTATINWSGQLPLAQGIRFDVKI